MSFSPPYAVPYHWATSSSIVTVSYQSCSKAMLALWYCGPRTMTPGRLSVKYVQKVCQTSWWSQYCWSFTLFTYVFCFDVKAHSIFRVSIGITVFLNFFIIKVKSKVFYLLSLKSLPHPSRSCWKTLVCHSLVTLGANLASFLGLLVTFSAVVLFFFSLPVVKLM